MIDVELIMIMFMAKEFIFYTYFNTEESSKIEI